MAVNVLFVIFLSVIPCSYLGVYQRLCSKDMNKGLSRLSKFVLKKTKPIQDDISINKVTYVMFL
jgi:hypothetical protein